MATFAPPAPISFTLDLEDHRPDDAAELRYPNATRSILEHLGAHDILGTFFVVGIVAEAEPDLVREIADAGHEVALHGWRHIPLVEHTPDSLRDDITRGKHLLEELTGQACVGYRAPTFSLVASTTWATEVLHDAGFTYSSSVLPTSNPLYGYPGAPGDPFLWPCGLAELPVPIAGPGRARVPYLGGTYLRLIPSRAIQAAHERGGRRVPWTYMHPYDIDTGERYWNVPDAGLLSPLLWVGRRGVLTKLDRLLGEGGHAGGPLRDRLDEARRGGTFDPDLAVASTKSTKSAKSTTRKDPMSSNEFTQATMVHKLPKAPLVDRIDDLVARSKGKRVIHVGFVDTGCRTMQEGAGAWLHAHLNQVATSLVGIDIDEAGVKDADAAGYEVYVADCRDPHALAALGIDQAELVIAGEVIEHLDDPGAFLAGLHELVAPGGQLIVTTPNGYGLFNVAASLALREINHPDHVMMFTWRTLTNLGARHGWEPVETRVYVPSVKDISGHGLAARLLGVAARLVVGIERTLARLGRGYAADGMLVVFRSTI